MDAVVVEARRGLSLVWLIPLIALVAGGWVAYRAWSETGPTITITFPNAEGLEAGKTKIKFKNVEVGEVQSVWFTDDLQGVEVIAELGKGAEAYLTDKTRFWIEKPRITASEVAGLTTLLSGAYIGVDPVADGNPTRDFVALAAPPVVTAGEAGRHFILRATRRGSLNVGSPLYYRQIVVGQVVSVDLVEDGKFVDLRVFVAAPHDQLVRKNTRFWNASGLDVTIDASGIKIDTQSFVSVMMGGIAFDTVESLASQEPAAADELFTLYETRESIREISYVEKETFLLYFTGTVGGLTVGSPVELNGMKIGEVSDFRLEVDVDSADVRIPVLIQIERERVTLVGSGRDYDEIVKQLVANGLRAQLKTKNILTGQLAITMDFYPQAPPAEIVVDNGYRVFPTVPSTAEEIAGRVQTFMERLESVPVEQIGRDLNEIVAGLNDLVNDPEIKEIVSGTNRLINNPDINEIVHGTNRLVNDPAIGESIAALRELIVELQQFARTLNTDAGGQIATTLTEAERALQAASGLLQEDSALQTDVRRMLRDFSDTARSIQSLMDYLERHPEALLRGKGEGR